MPTQVEISDKSDLGMARYLDPELHSPQFEPDALEIIPVVDVEEALTSNVDVLEKVAAEVCRTHEQIGFLAVINHGVSWVIINSAYDAIREFFALPMAEKLKIKYGKLSSGYYPTASTVYVSSPVNKNTKSDLNENLRIVKERPPEHPAIVSGKRFHGPNQWPEGVPNFKARMLEYYDAMESFCQSLLPIYARALDLPKDWFNDKFTDPMWSTRNSFYPAKGGPVGVENNQFGIAPHCDHGFITVLPLSREPGLEVLARTGRWIPVEIPEGALLINAGEFMHRWTNGRFFATPHRVLPPENDRYSLGFFFNPTQDVSCTPLDTCCSRDNPPKYNGMSIHDYLSWYVDRNYLKSAGGKQNPQSV